VPASVATGGQVAISMGGLHSCSLTLAGAPTCWGRRRRGSRSPRESESW
jgi:hypothetical protein